MAEVLGLLFVSSLIAECEPIQLRLIAIGEMFGKIKYSNRCRRRRQTQLYFDFIAISYTAHS